MHNHTQLTEAPRIAGTGRGLHNAPGRRPLVRIGQGRYRRDWPANQPGLSDRDPPEEDPTFAPAVYAMLAAIATVGGLLAWLVTRSW